MKKISKIVIALIITVSICGIAFNSYAYDIWQTGRDFIGLGANETRNWHIGKQYF